MSNDLMPHLASTRNALAVITTSPSNGLSDQAKPIETSCRPRTTDSWSTTDQCTEPRAALLARLGIDPQQIDADQYDRIEELCALGSIIHADRIALCGLKPHFARCRCKLTKICPRCGRELAARRAQRARAIVASFSCPHFLTLELVSPGFFGLTQGLDQFRDAFGKLRRLSCFTKSVQGGVAGLEPHYTKDGSQLWAIHAHAILDALEPFDPRPLTSAWFELVGDRGSLLIPPQGSEVSNAPAAATYITKSADWCPAPHSLPLSALRQLSSSMRGRHTFFAWGSARARR